MPRQKTHPKKAVLRSFARSEASSEEVREVVRHLLRGCEACGRTLAEVAPELYRRGPVEEPERVYEEAMVRAVETAQARSSALRREKAGATRFVPSLCAQPRPRRLMLLSNSDRGQQWAVCEDLLEASFECRLESPQQMVELAELAFRVAVRLDPERYGRAQVIDLQARTAAELANALRVADKHEEALETMVGALQMLKHGSGDPLLKARVYDLASSLLLQRQRVGLSIDLLKRSYRIYRRFGDQHLAGRSLLKRAVSEGYKTPAASLALLVEAVELIDPYRDRHLAWTAVHNLLWGLMEIGRYEAARELLEESRPLYEEFSDRRNVLLRLWLEGRLAAGLGHLEQAEMYYIEAYMGFNRAGRPYNAALVQLDLALLLGSQGRLDEVRSLVGEILATFRALKSEREAIAALLMLKDNLDRHGVLPYLIKKLQILFRRLPNEPGLRLDQV